MHYVDIRTFAKPSTAEEGELRKKQYPFIRIKEWAVGFLKRTDIKKNSDGGYDVAGHIDITNLELKSIQELGIRFGAVGGDFDCKANQLKSLQGCPSFVGGDFDCDYNQLASLQGSPSSVGGNFYCDNNKKKFTKEEVRAVCKVKATIYV